MISVELKNFTIYAKDKLGMDTVKKIIKKYAQGHGEGDRLVDIPAHKTEKFRGELKERLVEAGHSTVPPARAPRTRTVRGANIPEMVPGQPILPYGDDAKFDHASDLIELYARRFSLTQAISVLVMFGAQASQYNPDDGLSALLPEKGSDKIPRIIERLQEALDHLKKHSQTDAIAHGDESNSPFTIGLPGDLHPSTIKLVLDTAYLMAQKLMNAQRKYGWSCAPQTREEAAMMVSHMQKKFDLVDDNAVLKGLMDKMEDRHGEEFNSFYEATIRQILRGSGMTEVRIDTAAVLRTLAEDPTPLHVTEIPGYLVYSLVEDVETGDDQ